MAFEFCKLLGSLLSEHSTVNGQDQIRCIHIARSTVHSRSRSACALLTTNQHAPADTSDNHKTPYFAKTSFKKAPCRRSARLPSSLSTFSLNSISTRPSMFYFQLNQGMQIKFCRLTGLILHGLLCLRVE